MTEESVNANYRKCVTLRLDPCPLELGREANISEGLNGVMAFTANG